jgi:putative SOS response-associated peptidase YedK
MNLHQIPFNRALCKQIPPRFARVWERWKDAEGHPVETCSIITTAANGVVRPVHDRIPVILDPAQYGQWLDPRSGAEELLGMLPPAPEEWMAAVAVSSYVSNARNQGRSVRGLCSRLNCTSSSQVAERHAQQQAPTGKTS